MSGTCHRECAPDIRRNDEVPARRGDWIRSGRSRSVADRRRRALALTRPTAASISTASAASRSPTRARQPPRCWPPQRRRWTSSSTAAPTSTTSRAAANWRSCSPRSRPAGCRRRFFCNSGAEAIEGAMRLAKQFTASAEIVRSTQASTAARSARSRSPAIAGARRARAVPVGRGLRAGAVLLPLPVRSSSSRECGMACAQALDETARLTTPATWRVHRRAGDGRGRHHRRRPRLLQGVAEDRSTPTAACSSTTRCRAVSADGQAVRHRALRRRARHPVHGQGHRRRLPARRLHRPGGHRRGLHARRSPVDLRRQPGVLRRRPRQHRGDADEKLLAERRRPGASRSWPACASSRRRSRLSATFAAGA